MDPMANIQLPITWLESEMRRHPIKHPTHPPSALHEAFSSSIVFTFDETGSSREASGSSNFLSCLDHQVGNTTIPPCGPRNRGRSTNPTEEQRTIDPDPFKQSTCGKSRTVKSLRNVNPVRIPHPVPFWLVGGRGDRQVAGSHFTSLFGSH